MKRFCVSHVMLVELVWNGMGHSARCASGLSCMQCFCMQCFCVQSLAVNSVPSQDCANATKMTCSPAMCMYAACKISRYPYFAAVLCTGVMQAMLQEVMQRQEPLVSNSRVTSCTGVMSLCNAGDVTRGHAKTRASGSARQLEPKSDMFHMCDVSVQCRQCHRISCRGNIIRVSEAA